jgi:hypothetical protein
VGGADGIPPVDSFQQGGPGFFSCAVRTGENPGRSAFFFHHYRHILFVIIFFVFRFGHKISRHTMKIIPLYQLGTAEPSHIQAKKQTRFIFVFIFIVLFFIGTGQEIPDNIMLTVMKLLSGEECFAHDPTNGTPKSHGVTSRIQDKPDPLPGYPTSHDHPSVFTTGFDYSFDCLEHIHV